MSVPDWAQHFLKQEDLTKVYEAVKAAESSTTAEIVPMIVRRSSVVQSLPYYLMIMLVTLGWASGFHQTLEGFLLLQGFNEIWSWGILSLIVIGICFLSFPLARLSFIQRILISIEDRSFQVHERAELEFYRNSVQKTEQKTGVLIFISLMEHQAVILADSAISSKLPPDTWNEIIEILLGEVKQGRPSDGLVKAVQKTGEKLAAILPASPSDRNEISNQLIIKE